MTTNPKTKPKDQLYISRIDQGHTHCWTVRILPTKPGGFNATITDGVHGGKRAALRLAKEIRDEALKNMSRLNKLAMNRKQWPNYFSAKGYYLGSREREHGTYYFYNVFCYDHFERKLKSKSYSVDKYGKREAERLAITKRKQFVDEVYAKARRYGLKPE